MGIMTRFTRICKADLHGVMDQIEDKGLILKQCLREMETSLAQKQAQLTKMAAALEQAQSEHRKYHTEHEKLEQDLDTAISKDKDNIARVLIKKLKTMEQHMTALDENIESLKRRINAAKEVMDSRQQDYEQLRLKSETYFEKTESRQWEAAVVKVMPETVCAPLSEEEIELELIKRKESRKGGA